MADPPGSPDWTNGYPDWPEPDFCSSYDLDPLDYPDCDFTIQPIGLRVDSIYGDVYVVFGAGTVRLFWTWCVALSSYLERGTR